MMHLFTPVPASIAARDTLHFITCGSVDDGKSTLIGRMLFEAGQVAEDIVAAARWDSQRWGTTGEDLDYALMVDGLAAEREQGITIDVAYRFFASDRRHFIVADTPGHEQYTRNMITGASTADAAVILVNAAKGIQTQTRRHIFLVSLMGIRKLVLAINKMDLVGFDQMVFTSIVGEFQYFCAPLGFDAVVSIPLCATRGDNIVERSVHTPWYAGPSLLGALESIENRSDTPRGEPFRMPVQWVNRPHPDFRGYAGTPVSGCVRAGDTVIIQPGSQTATISRIVTFDGDIALGESGRALTLMLDREVDASRGSVISHAHAPCEVSDQFEATLVWMNESPLLVGRNYRLKLGTGTVNASVTSLKHKYNVNTLEHVAGTKLNMNEIGVCNISVDQPIAFEPYRENRELGGFILVDRISNSTVGAGLLHFALRRSHNIHLQSLDVDKRSRAALNGHKAGVLWFTGLSGAGKSTIANLVERELHANGKRTYLLDGDNLRLGLNRDLGFTPADRVENIRRVGEVSKLMVDAGMIVLVALISPFLEDRRRVRSRFEPGEFFEIHIDLPLATAEERDPKGLYRKARAGLLPNFTGIDSPYEPPEAPEILVRSGTTPTDQAVIQILEYLRGEGWID